MKSFRHYLSSSLFALACVVLAAAPAAAQFDRGQISGRVKDAQAAVVPGATVTATNQQTQVSWNTVTDGTGWLNSGFVQPAKVFDQQMPYAGTYAYTCVETTHPANPMNGTVKVPVNATPKSALDAMQLKKFAAMASTQSKPWASIPAPKLVEALNQRTGNTYVQYARKDSKDEPEHGLPQETPQQEQSRDGREM